MVLKELTNEEFTKFAESFPIQSPFQTTEYAFIMNKQKFDSFFLGLLDNSNNIVGATLILVAIVRGVKYAYAPRGFLIDYNNYPLLEEFTDSVKKFLNRNDIAAIKINPLIVRNSYDKKGNIVENNEAKVNILCQNLEKLEYNHLGFNDYFEAFKPRFEAIVDLNRPYYEIFNSFKKSLRTKIRKADKYGCRIYKGSVNNLEYLYEHTKSVYPRGLKYFQDCYDFFSKKDMVDFYYAKLDTKIYLIQVQKQYELQEQYVQYLNNEIIKHNLVDYIELLGYRPDVIEIMKCSDIFIMPSFREGLPRSVMEALACGLPIISSNSRGNIDLVKDTKDCFVVPINDSDHFAEIILKAINTGIIHNDKFVDLNRIRKYDLNIVLKEIKTIYNL
jgi:lipid II:glycine glycyltransferase (peptidoglycan interpeptide bridge formation enzyme)